MNTLIVDDGEQVTNDKPGAKLAAERMQKGYSQDYVANKLHLRVRIIELLEADDYQQMPEPVFIKGYLRAYAKLLDISAQPLLDTFNRIHESDRKPEKALWQSKRETNKAEHAVRWLTSLFALVVIIAVAMWWHTNKDNEHLIGPKVEVGQANTASNQSESEIRLTDLSNMRSLLSSPTQNVEAET